MYRGSSKWPRRTKKVVFNSKNGQKLEEDESSEVKRLIEQRNTIDSSKIKKFNNFPLSRRTKVGLKDSNYVQPTEIQKEAIGLALRGFDILGAAKTGSGKTLAFLIPVMELLYTKLWTKTDGLGALIITPTRELAYQIYETLKKIGKKHEFSAALVIGGQNLKFEQKRMDQVNILICTPGRLLQHMDQNASFDCLSLQILILDEADRCLDMGFEKDMNAILENLPQERQTLLFSATQTKSVKDLARLSLKSPVYVSVDENADHSTPENLRQSYVVCPLESKLDLLWNFLTHKDQKKCKILVFLSTCKQVRFVHELFRRMRPGMSILALHGSMHQDKRMTVYNEFCRKQVVLFATDIASRGLDFPGVDWVVQIDCPEDATTYIHRVGRTARYNRKGEALLVLMPSEVTAALAQLNDKKIPIEGIQVKPEELKRTIRRKFEALLARDVSLKECAQRAFKAYLKHVSLTKNKDVFDVEQLDLPSFARSLGLAIAPRVRFLQKKLDGKQKQSQNDCQQSDSEDTEVKFSKSLSTIDFHVESEGSEDEDDLFISKKPSALGILDPDDPDMKEIGAQIPENKFLTSKKSKSKATLAKKLLKKNIQVNKKCNFDEEGITIIDTKKQKQSDLARSYETEEASGIDVDRAKEILRLEDKYDKEFFRERIRARHREERLKAKHVRKRARNDAESEDEDPASEPMVKIGKSGRDHSSDEDESDSEPDLDWLNDIDIDKIYGSKKQKDVSPTPSNQSSADAPRTSTKVKRKTEESENVTGKVSKKFRKSSKGKHSVEPANDNFDSAMMEELALKLLQE